MRSARSTKAVNERQAGEERKHERTRQSSEPCEPVSASP